MLVIVWIVYLYGKITSISYCMGFASVLEDTRESYCMGCVSVD